MSLSHVKQVCVPEHPLKMIYSFTASIAAGTYGDMNALLYVMNVSDTNTSNVASDDEDDDDEVEGIHKLLSFNKIAELYFF